MPERFDVWILPAAAGVVAHLVLGPKQRRPLFPKVPGAMYTFAGVAVDRNAGCRGGYTLGSTGSGKTLACNYARLHSLCVNQGGVEAGPPSAPVRGRQSLLGEASSRAAAAQRNYRVAPWGGLIFGEKGNEWEAMSELFACYDRFGDLLVLRTRPAQSNRDWTAAVRLNLLGSHGIPADTYAKLIVDAGLAVEEAQRSDEFFVPQARDKIAWGIRLLREVSAVPRADDYLGTVLSLNRLFEILTAAESYRAFVDAIPQDRVPSMSGIERAKAHLERHYWNQPADQLGGLVSTIYNFLVPYTEPAIAEVFCSDSTFELEEIEQGKVVCLAIPQRLAVQRRYIATLLKGMAYQIIINRFDRSRSDEAWRNRNVIVIEQDEWQRYAVRADCDVDVIREAAGTTYAASQTQDAVWSRFRSKETAAPLIANLRNRWICQAGTDACAEESARLLGESAVASLSHTRGNGAASTTRTIQDRAVVSKSELRSLPPFHVIFAPAEGPWLYKKVIAMPVTPSGDIPRWWFGTWNPIHWIAHLLPLPFSVPGYVRDEFVAPWNAQAPLRAQFRWLIGLDGTYIVLSKLRRKQAMQTRGR